MRDEILEALPVGLVMLDNKETLVFMNQKAKNLLGCQKDNSIGKQAGEIFRGTPLAKFWSQKERPAASQVNFGGGPVIVQLTPLSNNSLTVLSLIELKHCADLWREMADLKEAKNNLDAIFNSSYDEIYITDGRGITLWLNKMGEENRGVKSGELIGKHVEELERAGYFPSLVTKSVLKERRKITLPQKTRDGKQVIVTGNPLFDESGNITRVVINSRDISEFINLQYKLEETETLNKNYRKMIAHLRQQQLKEEKEVPMVSVQMKRLMDTADKVAQVDSNVIITGESGVGKGVLASRIHKLSRPKGPFVQINCGAIPENLLESELFGYEGGAFTGARKEGKKGLIEVANGGTLFLDEVAELPLNLQVKLLQVLQERKIIRVGGCKEIEVDVRIITATNRDIRRMVAGGLFREDLYYRLNVIPMTIPPLRCRREDIPPLINYFLARLNLRYNINKDLSPAAMNMLVNYNWPGNIRELENIVERVVVTTEGNEILAEHIPDYLAADKKESRDGIVITEPYPLKKAVEELERQIFALAYQRFRNTYKIADALKVSQSTVVRRILKYRLASNNELQESAETGDVKAYHH
ncbi:sigma 54-interacting transcriptional regulator [Pelotomaculum propionicicum]|uniref:sigma 54-interacting transcriptional regulator n=1 Tax=Pelotomaculum propionicicum TaxID=258475 RepID=UPI003B7E4D1D